MWYLVVRSSGLGAPELRNFSGPKVVHLSPARYRSDLINLVPPGEFTDSISGNREELASVSTVHNIICLIYSSTSGIVCKSNVILRRTTSHHESSQFAYFGIVGTKQTHEYSYVDFILFYLIHHICII